MMSFPVYTVSADRSMAEVAKMLEPQGMHRPAGDGRRGSLVGIISRRDFKKIRKQIATPGTGQGVHEQSGGQYSGPGKAPSRQPRIMVRHDIGRLPVVADDRIIGIITRSDVMTYFYDLLPD
jgi:tRNA nucleotidyltransferase (CCA-adding enzyme)